MSNISRWCLTVVAALTLQFATAPDIAAQDRGSPPKTFCFRGKPASACKWFLLTEFGVDFDVVGKPVDITLISAYDGHQSTYRWEPTAVAVIGALGVMRNIGPSDALGAELTAIPGPDGPLFGVKARYRRWLTEDLWAVDAAAGVVAGNDDLAVDRQAPPGFSADLALSYKDYFGVTARYEMLRGNGNPKPLLYTGAKVGGVPSLGIAALLGIAVVVAMAAAGG